MHYYHVWPIDDDDADSYWVLASSENEACRFVALNVEAASNARDSVMYGCELDDRKTPPDSLIYRRLSGPHPITKR